MSPATRRLVDAASVAVFAALCAVGVAGCTRHEPPPPPPPAPPAKVDQDILDGAFHECFAGECERAYAHLGEIAATSPLRRTDPYRAVVYRHDAERVLKADEEPDLTKRREMLLAIAGAPATDAIVRMMVSARLARLGSASPSEAREVVLNAAPDAASPAAIAAQASAELLRMSTSPDPGDQRRLRQELEPRIYSGKGTADDVAMLRTVCKAQRDATCLKQLDHLILN